MLIFQLFDFTSLWSPYFLLLLFTIAILMMFIMKEPVKKQYMLLSLLLLYCIKGSPLDLLSHVSFMMHMIQMSVLYLVIPPLFLRGLPDEWLRKILHVKILRFFTKPLIALFLFNGLFSVYHIPLVFDFIKINAVYHGIFSVFLFIAALLMWWQLVQRLEGEKQLAGLQRIGYIFSNGVLLTPACALIIFAKEPMYMTFSNPESWQQAMSVCVPPGSLQNLGITGPELLLSTSLLQDQQNGGVIMKIMQEIIYGIALAMTFFSWVKEEKEATQVNDRLLEKQLSR